jgi:hypothetical protein
MSLLSTHEVKQKIIDEVSHASDNLQIISAFCKLPAIKFIDDNISRPIKAKTRDQDRGTIDIKISKIRFKNSTS